MDLPVMCFGLAALFLIVTLAAGDPGFHSNEKEKLIRFRMHQFRYEPKTVSKKFTKGPSNLRTTTHRPRHFFETTRTELLEWFRECPVSVDNGQGSFYHTRLAELSNASDFQDKSYILKELGDKLAPSGKANSKSLYLSGYRFLSDERNIDMIVKFFDVEVDKEGNELPMHQRLHKKLFAGGNVLVNNTLKRLKPLFVSETYLMEYQGRIPCVLFNFSNITGTSYEAIRQQIAIEIRKIFVKFSYLFQPHMLSKRAQNSYDIYSSGDVTHDELYNAILFVMRSIYKKYRCPILFVLNDGEDSIIVNYKTSVSYLISDNFANLKLQLLHKYANIVRRNLHLNTTETDDGEERGGDRLMLGSGEWQWGARSSTTDNFNFRKVLNRKFKKPNRGDKNLLKHLGPRGGFDLQFDVAGKDLFGLAKGPTE